MGFPDYRGARAIEVAFSGDLIAPEGLEPVRAGLVMPLLGEEEPHSLLGVLTRDQSRRFSEDDVDALQGLVHQARPPISRALNLREPDVVPELDMLTNLLDRQSFPSVVEREILRARLASHPLSLLVLDVDRLTALNARIGILAADGVLLELAKRLRAVVHRLDYAFRLGGGRFAVVRPGPKGSTRASCTRRFGASSRATRSATRACLDLGRSRRTVDARRRRSLVARAESALGYAKRAGRGTVNVAERRRGPSGAYGVLAGDRVAREPGDEG